MAIEDRRERERAARRDLIVATARQLAESEGWEAVTTRRLSTEIEYSQPVLYKHFAGMEQIAAAVAVDGFGELADALQAANSGTGALGRVAQAYLDFGPRVASWITGYQDAMFSANGPELYFWLPIVAPIVGGLIGGALFVFGIERFLPAAEALPHEVGVAEAR